MPLFLVEIADLRIRGNAFDSRCCYARTIDTTHS